MFEEKVLALNFSVLGGLFIAILITNNLAEKGIVSTFPLIPIEMFASAILAWTLTARYQRGKIFEPLIQDQLKEQGFALISERPLTFREMINRLEIKPAILINGMPVESYSVKARNERVLHVKTISGKELLLYVAIIKTWKNKIELEIKEKHNLN